LFFVLFCKTCLWSFSQQVIAQSVEIIDFSFIFKARLHTPRRALIKFALRIYFEESLHTNHHDKMSYNNTASLNALPIELIYCILDHLSPKDILLYFRNVCERLNSVTDLYHPYQVNFASNFLLDFHRRFEGKYPSEINHALS
jgi:hypothetical protein